MMYTSLKIKLFKIISKDPGANEFIHALYYIANIYGAIYSRYASNWGDKK